MQFFATLLVAAAAANAAIIDARYSPGPTEIIAYTTVVTTTFVSICTTDGTTFPSTITATYTPSLTSFLTTHTLTQPIYTAPSGVPVPSGNGTVPIPSGGAPPPAPTKTPVGPSATPSPPVTEFPGAASGNKAYGMLAAAGLVVAYFL